MLNQQFTSGFTDELTYRSYAHNRRRSPDIEPSAWADIFPTWGIMEERLFLEHVEASKIVFPSVLMAAHYRDNWKPAGYKLGPECDDPQCSRYGQITVEAWDGGVDLFCFPCA